MHAATDHGHLAGTGSIDHGPRYERFLLWAYLLWRWLSVAVYGASTWESRRRYRRPRVAVSAWAVMAAECIWSTRRLLRDPPAQARHVGTTAAVDTITSGVILCLLPYALEGGDDDIWRAWHVIQAKFQAEAAPFVVTGLPGRIGAAAFLCAALAASKALGPGRVDPHELGSEAVSMAMGTTWTSLFAGFVRANAATLDQTHADALVTARQVALQRSRTLHRRALQDEAVKILDAITNAEHPRSRGLRIAANREASRLRRLLLPADGQHLELAAVVDTALERGVDLEIVSTDPGIALPPQAVEAVRSVVIAAFGGDTPSCDRAEHAVLFVDIVDTRMSATLRGGDVLRTLRVTL